MTREPNMAHEYQIVTYDGVTPVMRDTASTLDLAVVCAQRWGSFMDYCMPRADDLPFFATEGNEVITKGNPLGVKGGGEAGTTGALAVVMGAIVDALAPYGITELQMPATPERVWRAIQGAAAGMAD